MLKKITKWETEDGKVFDTQEEAEDYMFEQEKEVMTQTPSHADFEAWLAPEYSRKKWQTGEYIDDTVFSMFAAWQAARLSVPQDIAKLRAQLEAEWVHLKAMQDACKAMLVVAPSHQRQHL